MRQIFSAIMAVFVLFPVGFAQAEVPRWVVRDDDTTLVLFPTLHVLKAEIPWLTRVNQSDMRAADTLILELAPSEKTTQRMQPLLVKHARLKKKQKNVFDLLPPQDSQAFKGLIMQFGLNPKQVVQMRPWFAGVTIVDASFKQAGYVAANGVEAQILAYMEKQDFTVRGLETLEMQVRLFADMDIESELSLLRQTIKQARTAPVFIDQLTKAWLAADMEKLEQVLHNDLLGKPKMYQRIFVDRNDRWAEQLTLLMAQEEGVKYVALGAGHFVGPGNLLDQFRRRGLQPVRLPNQIR